MSNSVDPSLFHVRHLKSRDDLSQTSADEHPSLQGPVKRRSFLRRAAMVTGASAASASLLIGDSETILAQASPRVSLSSQMKLVQRHENEHVTFLVNALGGVARPKPTFQNLAAANVSAFLTRGNALENTGVGAYLAATPIIFDRSILAAAASIALIEARHAGLFNSVQSRASTENVNGLERSFEEPLSLARVIELVSPYVVSLNGGPPLAFDSSPSPENDVAILNFALALEYLEAEYYNVNVPRFYP